jgi:hypothetical protein
MKPHVQALYHAVLVTQELGRDSTKTVYQILKHFLHKLLHL